MLKDLKIIASDADLQGMVVTIYDRMPHRVLHLRLLRPEARSSGLHSYWGSIADHRRGHASWRSLIPAVIAGRLIGGIGTGLETTFVPIWVAECARASRRGVLIAAQLTVVIVGLNIAY